VLFLIFCALSLAHFFHILKNRIIVPDWIQLDSQRFKGFIDVESRQCFSGAIDVNSSKLAFQFFHLFVPPVAFVIKGKVDVPPAAFVIGECSATSFDEAFSHVLSPCCIFFKTSSAVVVTVGVVDCVKLITDPKSQSTNLTDRVHCVNLVMLELVFVSIAPVVM
jgi:hypothetical protein